MTDRGQKLLADALALAERERAELASELIASLDGAPDPDAEELWAEEIRRRIEEYDKNPSRAEDWSVAKARIEKKLWERKRDKSSSTGRWRRR